MSPSASDSFKQASNSDVKKLAEIKARIDRINANNPVPKLLLPHNQDILDALSTPPTVMSGN